MRYLTMTLLVVTLALAGCEKDGKVAGPVQKVEPGKVVVVETTPKAGGTSLPTGNTVSDMKGTIAVPAAAGPIKADGKLDEPAWKDATALTGFVGGKGAGAAPVQTRVLVTYDKDNLYIAVINDEPETGKIIARAADRDDKRIWGGDDHDEIYIDPTAAKGANYMAFFVTTKNVVYDRQKVEAWDGQWTSGTQVIDGKAWVAEMAIPWKTLEVKDAKAGHKLGLMVARARSAGKRGDFYLVNCNEEAKDTSCYPTLQLK